MTPWQFTPYLLLVGIAALLTTSLAIYTWYHRHTPGGKYLFFLLAAAAVWSVGYTFEIASTTLEAKLFWVRIEYLGIATVPFLWLLYTLRFTGREYFLTRFNIALVAVIPTITILLVWSSQFQNLYYTNVDLRTEGGVIHFDPTYGPWFWVHVIFSYTCYLVGTFLLLQQILYQKGDSRRQSAVILAGSLPPFLVSIIFVYAPTTLDRFLLHLR